MINKQSFQSIVFQQSHTAVQIYVHSNHNKALHIQHTLSAVQKVNSTYTHDHKIQVSYKK